MNKYGAFCDEFYLNMHLATEMDLPKNREAVLHFFEQIQKRFPAMGNFYSRGPGEFFLEEEKQEGKYCWVSTEPKRLCSGSVNPETVESAIEQHKTVLSLIPYELSISHLDCESLNVTMGFDFNFRGNQNELLAEALGMVPALDKLNEESNGTILGYEPVIQIALEEDCRTQCRLAFETRTTAFQVRSGEYNEEQISVYLTLRRFDSLNSKEDFGEELVRLVTLAESTADNFLIENVLTPLKQTIALK